jgi:hypothetical protein
MTLRFHWYLPTNGDGRDIAEAWRQAARLIEGVNEDAIRTVQDELGLSEFILSGYPHLEEAYWFGEGVLPILRARGLWRHPFLAAPDGTRNTTPVGAPPELTPGSSRHPAAVP